MTSKQRAYLKSISSTYEPILQIGKGSVTPEMIASVNEAIEKRELIKLAVLKNCADDPRDVAQMIADRTHSTVVHVIGRKIILYKPAKDKEKRKIVLPLY